MPSMTFYVNSFCVFLSYANSYFNCFRTTGLFLYITKLEIGKLRGFFFHCLNQSRIWSVLLFLFTVLIREDTQMKQT